MPQEPMGERRDAKPKFFQDEKLGIKNNHIEVYSHTEL